MIHKILETIQKFFSMNKNQSIASLLLLSLMLVALLLYPIVERSLSHSNSEISITTTEKLDSTLASLSKQEKNYLSEYQAIGENGNTEKTTFQRFAFDPNTASREQLVALGFPKGSATSLLNYRAKGGRLRYKEDVLKIYFFPPELYGELESYILLPSKEAHETQNPQDELAESIQATPAINKPSEVPSEIMPPQPKSEKLSNPATQAFDLNTADTTQLKKLKGVGSGYASRIIKYRDLMGGFYDINQVKRTYNLPPEVADEVVRFCFVKKPVHKININTISLESFKHPELKFNQKKALIAYREQHGSFQNIDDLRKIKLLDEESIQRISPYLEF